MCRDPRRRRRRRRRHRLQTRGAKVSSLQPRKRMGQTPLAWTGQRLLLHVGAAFAAADFDGAGEEFGDFGFFRLGGFLARWGRGRRHAGLL